MADGTTKLSVEQRLKVKAALLQKYKAPKNYIHALAKVRLLDSKAEVTQPIFEKVACQVRRILRANDGDPRNGVLTAEWKETFLKACHKLRELLSGGADKGDVRTRSGTAKAVWPKGLSRGLADEVVKLHVGDEAQRSVIDLLIHPNYPQRMSIGGVFVNNPIWREIPTQRRSRMRKAYPPEGPTPPRVMHLDVLLIRRDNHLGRGEIYTYFSPDWETNLLHFRQWLPEDDPSKRNQLNSVKLSRHWEVPSELIAVEAMPGKFAVSVKPHPKHGDLFLYVFDFCSVRFRGVSEKLKMLRSLKSDFADNCPWRELRTLRTDPASWAVNGDAIRAIHELFSVNLDGLPNSFSDAEAEGQTG